MYQPFEPRMPAADNAADGPVLSSFTVSVDASAVRPASFVHDPWKSVPVVSEVWYWSPSQLTGPLIESPPVLRTVTSLVYQPFAPAVPAVTPRLADGPDLSNLTLKGDAPVVRPASFVHDPLNAWPLVSPVWN